MNNNLLIIGAGQYGQVVRAIAKDIGTYDKIDFLDDNNADAIGKWDDYKSFKDEYPNAFVALGENVKRLEWLKKLKEAGFNLPILIHPRAYVFDSARISKGTVVEPMAVVHTNVSIGVGCIIAAGSVICHGAVIENGVNCFSGCVVEEGAILKSNVTMNVNEVVKAKTIVNSSYEYSFDAGF